MNYRNCAAVLARIFLTALDFVRSNIFCTNIMDDFVYFVIIIMLILLIYYYYRIYLRIVIAAPEVDINARLRGRVPRRPILPPWNSSFKTPWTDPETVPQDFLSRTRAGHAEVIYEPQSGQFRTEYELQYQPL
jgi:hypothetical protein